MKKLISTIVCLSLIFSICIPAFAASESAETFLMSENDAEINALEKLQSVIEGDSISLLLFDDPAFTQDDLDSHFSNYAEPNSTVTHPATYNSIESTQANVVGIVLDIDNDNPIANASVYIDGEFVVKTGSDGRFQITNLPNGSYDWEVTSDSHQKARFLDYSVDGHSGTNIFTFYVDSCSEITKQQTHQFEVTPHTEDLSFLQNDRLFNSDTTVTTYSMSSKPTVSSVVNVYYEGQTRTINRQRYVYTVLSAELYDYDWYIQRGLTNSQTLHLYIAQAIVANTYALYAQEVYSNHRNENYEVCSEQCCQVYGPTKVTENAINATSVIFERSDGYDNTIVLLRKPTSTTYEYTAGMFFSSCNNQGTWTNANDSAMQAVTCTDLVPNNISSHHYGLCQMGAAVRAKNGDVFSEITRYYFTNCGNETCRLG